jgi:hypothetical protein
MADSCILCKYQPEVFGAGAQIRNALSHGGHESVYGSSDSAEADGNGVINEGKGTAAAERWEADADQKRSGKGCGSSESGGALDEGSEKEAYQDNLNSSVGRDVSEHTLNRNNGARVFQGVHDSDGAEDDDQNVNRAESS